MGVLYKLTSPSGKSYIGITTKTLDVRWAKHVEHSCGTRTAGALYAALRKYGHDTFGREVLAVCDDWDALRHMEIDAIRTHGTFAPSGYNMTLGGEGSAFLAASSLAKMKDGQKRAWARNYKARCKASEPAVAAMRAACADRKTEQTRRDRISSTMRARGIGVGDRNGSAKITSDVARDIKLALLAGTAASVIAAEHGISRRLVGMIKTGDRWRDA